MSDKTPSTCESSCPAHYMMVQGMNEARETSEKALKVAEEMQIAQQKNHTKMDEFMTKTAKAVETIANDIDEELRGGKGPEAKEGLKPRIRRTERDIVEYKNERLPTRVQQLENDAKTVNKNIAKTEVPWRHIVIGILGVLVVTVIGSTVAGLVIWILTNTPN